MLFDVRTVMLMAAGITVLLALCIAVTLGRYRAPVGTSARWWVSGNALQSLAWLAFSLRDLVPDVVSVLLGNALICLAYAEYPRALRAFHGDDRGWHAPRWIAAGVVLPVVLYTWIAPSVALRTVATSVFVMTLLALSAREILRAAPRPLPLSHGLTMVVFAAGALLLFVRVVFESLNTQPLTSGIATTPMQALTFGYMALMPVVATFGFALMCSEYTRVELEKLAATDPLTGALNRRMLEQLANEQLALASRHERSLSLLLLDADRFKAINDAHGHEVGDIALKNVVASARQQLRPGDLVGRLGGEEFLVLLIDTDAGEAALVAERLRASVAALDLRVRGESIPLSVSIGVATFGEHGTDFHELVRRADRAMYLAKRGGRNVSVRPPHLPPTG